MKRSLAARLALQLALPVLAQWAVTMDLARHQLRISPGAQP